MLIKHSLNKELLINYCIIKMMNLQHKYTHTYTRQHMKINFPHKKSSQLNYLCLRTQNEFNEFSLIIYLNVTKIFKFNSSSTTLSQHLFIYYSILLPNEMFHYYYYYRSVDDYDNNYYNFLFQFILFLSQTVTYKMLWKYFNDVSRSFVYFEVYIFR